jgi:hypothetical protein
VHFVPEEFSDFARASGTLAGDRKIHVPAEELDFVPFVGSADRRHLEVYFGDWETFDDVSLDANASQARTAGIITEVIADAKYRATQILWTFTVKSTAHSGT